MSSISFCATGKSGLGHLRRTANIAGALATADAASQIVLLTNAPSVGLPSAEAAIFDRIEHCERADMAARLAELGGGAVVVDTAVLPGLGSLARPLCLVLRQTPADKQATFRLEENRRWDLIIVPNPPGHWKPDKDALPAARVEAVGWTFRPVAPTTGGSVLADLRGERPVLLLASGGGGTSETARPSRRSGPDRGGGARPGRPICPNRSMPGPARSGKCATALPRPDRRSWP